MKPSPKLFILLIVIAFSHQLNATVRTVNNNNPSPGQFTTISAAISAAVSGDTLYISGSPTTYTGVSGLTKLLTFIGTGHNPDKQNPLVSNVDFLSVPFNGSKFIGINFISGLNLTSLNGTITYEHCRFNNSMVINNTGTFIFKKCIFMNSPGTNALSPINVTATFTNCVFKFGINSSSSNMTLSGSATNCMFLGSAFTYAGGTMNNFSFTNNIFYGISPQIVGTNTATTMTNNISYNCPNNNFNAVTLVGNIVNSNPLFTTYVPSFFKYTDNYVLQAASPGANAGTDGKDIGLYGGPDGVNFRMGGDPSIPQIRQMNIQDNSVPLGSPFIINIISTKKL
ncbi:MAG: hypothetical protein ABI772_11300 [Bacteroidota bacterium]